MGHEGLTPKSLAGRTVGLHVGLPEVQHLQTMHSRQASTVYATVYLKRRDALWRQP